MKIDLGRLAQQISLDPHRQATFNFESSNCFDLAKMGADDLWLERIAKDLSPDSDELPGIKGTATVTMDSAGFVHVTGHADTVAVHTCDRCARSLSLPLSSSFDATFRPPYASDAPKEMALSPEDFEVYFIENNAIDLEILVNDTLQCALPSKVTCALLDEECIAINPEVAAMIDGALVYSEQPKHAVESPFKVLEKNFLSANAKRT